MTGTPAPRTPIADGVLETDAEGRDVLRFERRLAHPVSRVWDAITDPAQLRSWWGVADVELAEGGRFRVQWLNDEDADGNKVEPAVQEATITRLDPPRVLETEGEPHGRLRFELREDGDDGTLLTFTCVVQLPDEHRTASLAGWHFHLDALATTLDGASVELVDVRPAWVPIHELYVERYARG